MLKCHQVRDKNLALIERQPRNVTISSALDPSLQALIAIRLKEGSALKEIEAGCDISSCDDSLQYPSCHLRGTQMASRAELLMKLS